MDQSCLTWLGQIVNVLVTSQVQDQRRLTSWHYRAGFGMEKLRPSLEPMGLGRLLWVILSHQSLQHYTTYHVPSLCDQQDAVSSIISILLPFGAKGKWTKLPLIATQDSLPCRNQLSTRESARRRCHH